MDTTRMKTDDQDPNPEDDSLATLREMNALRAQVSELQNALSEAETARVEMDLSYRELAAASRRQSQEIVLMEEIRTTLAQELDLHRVIRNVVEKISRTFGYDLVSLYLRRDDVMALDYQVGYEQVLSEIPINQGIIGRVVRTGKPVFVINVNEDPDYLSAAAGVTSEICVPLFDEDRVHGVLNVESCYGVELNEVDLRLMNAMGDHIGIAMRRAQYFSALRESEDRYRNLIEASPDSIWEINQDGIFTYTSPQVTGIFGYGPEELLGKTPFDLVPPAELSRIEKEMSAFFVEHRAFWRVQTQIVKKDGQIAFIESSGMPFFDELGTFLGFRGVDRDITEQKLAKDELYRSRQMLQMVLDNIPQRVFWKDRNFVYLGCNQNFALGNGLKDPSEIIGRNDFEINPAETARLYREDDRKVMEEDTPKRDFEEPLIQPDGTRLWLRTNKVPLHELDGRVIGILGTYEDITHHKRVEMELREANEKLTTWVSELEIRNFEANILRQMDDLLQVCSESEEAYVVIQQYGPQLFPETCGALYLINNSRRALEAMAVWGKDYQGERAFSPEECWALRRGQIHVVRPATPSVRCRHMAPAFQGDYIDFPMMASGETLGVLHIESQDNQPLGQRLEALSRTMGEHLALSLLNLKLRETLRAQSIRDPLTGLFNRRYMEESFERELSRGVRKQFSVGIIMMDIDHFKNYNDTYGHDAGDQVLREIGMLLQAQIRIDDIACRFGGEEFILILPDASTETTLRRAEIIRERVAAMVVDYQKRNLSGITLSMGVALFPEHGMTTEEVLRKADEALYLAKHKGRNRVEMLRATH